MPRRLLQRAEDRALRVIDSWPAWLPWAVVAVLALVLVDIVTCEYRGGYRP